MDKLVFKLMKNHYTTFNKYTFRCNQNLKKVILGDENKFDSLYFTKINGKYYGCLLCIFLTY